MRITTVSVFFGAEPLALPDGDRKAGETMQRAGFTIFELVVLVFVVMASTALVYPVVTSEIRRTDRANAEEQCQKIAEALEEYLNDRADDKERFPVEPLSGKPLYWLRGPGIVPGNNPFRNGPAHGRLFQVLRERDPSTPSWNGPYLDLIEPDPWGNAYLVNTRGLFDDRERVWVLSAGPDGIVDTSPSSRETRGDDIGRILR